MISVLLTAYMPDPDFFRQQVASILPQLETGDELLISDDSPAENTAAALVAQEFGHFGHIDKIRLLRGPQQGVIRNIEFLLTQAKGDILVFSDQDDVWLPMKLSRIREVFTANPACLLLLHDATVTDAALRVTEPSFFAVHRSRPGIAANLLRNSFVGCCMAFRAELLTKVLPFPKSIPMHDQWIGLCAARAGKVCFLAEPLLLYRRHSSTQTGGKTSTAQKLLWRFEIFAALLRLHSRKSGM
jgi:glycosyltransferase involved in cell wall biosynthesis